MLSLQPGTLAQMEAASAEEAQGYSVDKQYSCCPLFKEEITNPTPHNGDICSLKEIINRVLPEFPADL